MGEYQWCGTTPPSRERLTLAINGTVRAHAVVRTKDITYDYDMLLDQSWVFRDLRLSSSDGRHLQLQREGSGRWRQEGLDRPDLADAVDIDLAFSPFTNALPIRRLALPVGRSAEIVVAYVDAASLAVLPDRQRYTRRAVDRYLFESLDGDFAREITVDSDGLVIDYPGLFTRDTGIC